MTFLIKISDTLARGALFIAAVILVYGVCHILLETLLRSLFSTSTHVLDEFIGFAILSITFLSLAYTLRSGGMIRVSFLTTRLPRVAQRIGEVIVSWLAGGFAFYFCIFLARNFLKNWRRGAVSESVAEIPLWIPDLIVLIGASLLVLQLFLLGFIALFPQPDPAKDP